MDDRRKRLLFRSNHTGMKETDLLLGSFAAARLAAMNEAQVDRFEALLEEPDPDILSWIYGRAAAPARHDNDVLDMLKSFKYYDLKN